MSNTTKPRALLQYSFFDSFPEGVQVISPTFVYLYVNDAVAKQGQKKKQELLGSTMMACYPGIEQTKVFAAIKRCLKSKKEETFLNPFTLPDKSEGFFEVRLRPVPEGVMILSEDVTERERSFEENKKLFDMMVDREHKMAELKAQLKKD